jgi:hypothetical protein
MKAFRIAALIWFLAAPAGAAEARYVLGWWDGVSGVDAVWFRAEGPEVRGAVRIERVKRLEPGLIVRPEPGRLVLSGALALDLGVAPRTPTLLRLSVAQPEPRDRRDAPTMEAPLPEPEPLSEGPETRQARIAALLAALQAEAAAAARDDAAALAASSATPEAGAALGSATPAPAMPTVRRGGLVPFTPGDLP